MLFNTMFPGNSHDFNIIDTNDDVSMNMYYLTRTALKYNQARYHNSPELDKIKWLYENFIINGNWDFVKPLLNNVDTIDFDDFYCNNTIFTRNGKKKNYLIINLISQGAYENRLLEPYTNISISRRIFEHDIPMINIVEDPTRKPLWRNPANLLMGTNDTSCPDMDTLVNNIKQIADTITTDLEKCIIIGDSKHAGSVLSIAQKLYPMVTNVFAIHGLNNYTIRTNPALEQYENLLERIYNKEDGFEHLFMGEVEFFGLLKSAWFDENINDKRTLDPYRFLYKYPNIQVDYYYGKYDVAYRNYENYVKQFNFDNLNVHEVDFKHKHNTHFIKRHLEKFVIPEYIKNLTN